MNLTHQQNDFIHELVNGTSHIALRARAGTGKTSTLLEGVDAIVEVRPEAEIQCLMFNKANATETSGKLQKRGHTNWKKVNASTIHSAGYGLVRFAFNNPKIDDKKVYKLIDNAADQANYSDVFQQYGTQIANLVSLAKGEGFGFFPDRQIGDAHAWYQMAEHYDVNGLDDNSDGDKVVEAAQYIYRASLNQTNVIDFDDMILFPLVKNLKVKFGKDYIFGDEWQDTSRAKQALALKFLKPGGKFIMIGDDRQAIYGFAGADSSAMENMIAKLDAKIMPLSITWRCPKSVVRLATGLVPDYTAHDDAIEGEVRIVHGFRKGDNGEEINLIEEELATLTNEDAVLCRNMAPLVSLAYQLIRNGKACKVEGRAIGDGLTALVRRWKVKTIDKLLDKLADYQQRETEKAMAKGNERKAEEVVDKCGTLVQICEALLEEGKQDTADVIAFIDRLFADDVTGVTVLATYHRAKGREWPRVFLLEHHSRCPSRFARQQWQKEQEDNLAYVAYTRAQRELIFLGL